MGEGDETFFWEDKWVRDWPLYFVFPHLYHLSSFKNHLVSDFLVWSESSGSFCFGFYLFVRYESDNGYFSFSF